jgi:hypothetical protein
MKLLRLLLASVIVFLFMGVNNTAMAQTTSTIGTGTLIGGTNDNSGPIYRSSATSTFNFSRHVMLYTAADLTAAGIFPGATISKVAWYKTTAFTLAAGRTATMNISMQNSGATTLTTGTWDSKTLTMTGVYANAAITDANIPAVAGWVEFTLTTPFVYTGGALEIATDWAIAVGTGAAATGTFQWQYTTTTGTQSVGTSAGSALVGTSSLGSAFSRNMNVQLTHTGGAIPTCFSPTSLSAATSATGAVLNWTANSAETAWEIEYGLSTFTQGSGTTAAVTSKPYTLSGLTPNTAYKYYVRANCGATNGMSAWAGPFTFSTPCVAYTVPYFEGFETGYTDGTAVAGCLSQASITGTGVWTANSTQTSYNRAPYAGAWNAYLQYGNDDWMFIPIDLTGGTSYTFGAFVRQDGATATNSDVTVSYGTANNAAAMTNAIVPTTGIVDGAYQQLTGVFTPATTGTYYIGIKGYMNGSPWYISLDDISVISSPNCPAPNLLMATNVGATSATLGWTENGSATSWEVEYGTTGFTQGTGTAAVVSTNPYAASGLTFETNYQYYVRAICAPGDTSPWSAAGSFFTGYCTPAPSSVDGDGITNVTMGGVNNATLTETNNYGNYSAMVANAPQGGTLPIDITLSTGYTYDMWAWVDWNNNLDFTDAGEEYFLGTSASPNPSLFSGSIAIPATALGNYRIRIGGADTGLGTTSPSDPCYTGSWGAFEDYTLNVAVATPALMPFALLTPADGTTLQVAGPAQNTVDVTWESANVAGATYEWRLALPTGSLSTPLVALPSNNMGMDTMLTLDIQTIDGLLASLGVNVGDTATVQWSVVASANGNSLFATTPFTLSLIRYGVSSPLLLNAPQNTNSTTTLRAPNGSTGHTFMRAATVVLPTEFATAGIAANTTIRNFGFNVNGTIPAGAVTGIFKLYLQNTTDVTYGKGTAWAGITPGMTEVFNDTITINGGGAGWDVVLDALFAYGGNSVYVAYDWELVANPLATSISYMANTALAGGLVSAASATVAPATLAGSSFRPEFSWGIDRDADDLEVVTVFAMGKNPLVYSQAEQVQAIVRNNGYLPADKMVTLNITGANPYTTSENVTLAPGQETTVSFMAYNPTTAGLNAMSVSVPADQVVGNNAQTWVQETTTNTFSYADSVLTGLGGVGYNTGSGLLLNRYYVNGTAAVNQVRIRISDNAASVGNAIYAVLMDTSGTIVSQSANYTITAGDLETWVTFNLQTTVNVSNVDVLVGLAQTANVVGYFPIAFQGEDPTRPNAYFGADLNGANLGAVNGFRLMIEAVVGPACTSTSTVAITNASCFSQASGSITVTVVGGTAPFTYAWSNNQTTATATGLVAAVYNVTITDANGCSITNTGTVGQPAPIALAATSVSDTLTGSIGSASVTATGGTAPYTYAWSDGQTTATATGLAMGTYTVTVTDANGCTQTASAVVDDFVGTTRIDYVTNVSIYPNPTSGNTVIDLELSQNADIAVSIYTVTGVMVQDFGKENTSKTTHIIDVTEYPAGMYFVRFVVDNQVITKKLLVTK